MTKDIYSQYSCSNSRAICVLGMHRSGTSAVSRIINLLGVYLGSPDELYGQRYDNLKGFWERKDIVEFHDAMLQSICRRWDTALPLDEQWMSSEPVAGVRQHLKEIIVDAFHDQKIWAWKDPRTCIISTALDGITGRIEYRPFGRVYCTKPCGHSQIARQAKRILIR